jgi:hypothetical protein
VHGPDVIADRQHFFALAAQAMRRVLVDHARGKGARKRGRGFERVTLDLSLLSSVAVCRRGTKVDTRTRYACVEAGTSRLR